MPGPNPNRPKRPRPINPFDNPATTGLPVNPNGTYIANPVPTTAASGAQGAYGAMLPQVQVTTQFGSPLSSASQYNAGPSPLQQMGVMYNQLAGQTLPPVYSPGASYSPYGVAAPKVPQPQIPPVVGQYPPTGTPSSYNMDQRGRGYSYQTLPVPANTSGPQFDQRGRSYDLFNRIQEHPEEFDRLPPAQQDAIKNALSGGDQFGQTLGKGDFYGYERDPETGRSVRVVKNAADSNFLNEKRWDPQTKKYVSIGKLIKQGKLDLQGRTRKTSKRNRIASQQNAATQAAAAAAPQTSETTGGFTGTYGVVNFGTATG